MHGAPKLMIIAKRAVAGDEMPDFSGKSYHEARKCMIHGESEKMNRSSFVPLLEMKVAGTQVGPTMTRARKRNTPPAVMVTRKS